MWFQWIIDFGLPGPDRGAGRQVPPGSPVTTDRLPEGGFYVGARARIESLMLGRSFMVDDDPAPTVETIRSTLKVYPYVVGWPRHQRRHHPRGGSGSRRRPRRCPRPRS